MMLRGNWTRTIVTLLVLFSFSLVSTAIDLGLKLHQTQDETHFIWTSVGHFRLSRELTNEDLMGMARAAYQEMKADLDRKYPDKSWRNLLPGAMAAFAIENSQVGYTVVFSSSIKGLGGTSFIMLVGRPDNPAKNILIECQNSHRIGEPSSDKEHKTHANCAEPMALYAYYERFTKPEDDITKQSKRGRFAVWGQGSKNSDGQQMDPCTYPEGLVYGCKELIVKQKIDAIDKRVIPTDPNLLPEPTERFEVCIFPQNNKGPCCPNAS